MEEIEITIAEYGTALRRLMNIQVSRNSYSVCFGSISLLKRVFIILLWVLFGVSLFLCLASLTFAKSDDPLMVVEVFIPLAALCLLGIRILSSQFTVKVDEGQFLISGQLRKNKSFLLKDYLGAETLRTIKDFPEEFVIRFKDGNGTKRYKLADLNMGFSRNIEPNHEAVCALWESIVHAMEQYDAPNPITVVSDTD